MKITMLICIALLTGCLAGYSQITLNAGESFVYQFSSLSPVGPLPFGTPIGTFEFTVSSGTLQAGDVLQWEMFENSPSGSPLYADTYSIDHQHDLYGVSGAWQDLQGSIRFTMLSGSIGIDSFSMLVTVPRGLDDPFVYAGAVTPVPEPCSLFLAGTGLLASYCVGRRKRSA
jgi:hypothetical protein